MPTFLLCAFDNIKSVVTVIKLIVWFVAKCQRYNTNIFNISKVSGINIIIYIWKAEVEANAYVHLSFYINDVHRRKKAKKIIKSLNKQYLFMKTQKKNCINAKKEILDTTLCQKNRCKIFQIISIKLKHNDQLILFWSKIWI